MIGRQANLPKKSIKSKNTIAVRAGSHQAVSDSFIALNSWIARDPSLARIYRIGATSPDDLTEEEQLQFGFMLLSVFRAYETSFYQHRVGTLDEQLFRSIERDMSFVLSSPGVRQWWEGTPFSFSQEFREHLEANVVGAGGTVVR